MSLLQSGQASLPLSILGNELRMRTPRQAQFRVLRAISERSSTRSDRLIADAQQLLRVAGVNTDDPRLSLVFSVGEVAARQLERGLQNLVSEAARYTTGARREEQPSSWEDAFMSVPDLETIPYRVVDRVGGLEIRHVESYLVAETRMPSGTQGFDFFGSGQAFNTLADYLFGKNKPRESMEMTTPVVSSSSSSRRSSRSQGEAMDMTTPVMNAKGPQKSWSMAFVLPSKFDESTVPVPDNPNVTVKRIPPKLIAVLSFSGLVSDDDVVRRERQLREALLKLPSYAAVPGAEIEVAQYNPPFTIPFMRRNEVSLEVRKRSET